jgi:hypothetical protein
VILLALLTAALGVSVSAYAGSFHLELAYCDVQAGPLTVATVGGLPLPDGCLGQLIEHVSEGAVPRPDANGNPGGDDRLLSASPERRDFRLDMSFRVNGAERLQTAGFFLIDPALEGPAVPKYPLYVRIWNAADPAQATDYYETPLYSVRPGTQQMNFGRDQLTMYHVFEAGNVTWPLEFNILSSYPNPFNAEATLTYALEQPAQVALDLYDLQGRRAAELFNANMEAGAHNVHFNASDFPTGAYFAILKVNGANVSTRRMMLLK